MSDQPDPKATETVHGVVSEAMTAAAFAVDAGENYPRVLATPFLIADLERACAKLLEPLLGEEQLSVGAHIDIRHTAPTPVGGAYTCRATFASYAPPLYWFDVVAEDSLGVIGKGRIARAIVNRADVEAHTAKAGG